MSEAKRCEHYAICEQFKEPDDPTTLAWKSVADRTWDMVKERNKEIERLKRRVKQLETGNSNNDPTTRAQWKAVCDRAWEIVKGRDQEIKALKGQVKRFNDSPMLLAEAIRYLLESTE